LSKNNTRGTEYGKRFKENRKKIGSPLLSMFSNVMGKAFPWQTSIVLGVIIHWYYGGKLSERPCGKLNTI